jgi:polyphosphate kinase
MVSLFGLDSHNYVDRELGWIDFNSRVLALSEHPDIPLAERLRFLTIVSTNFDDFFMIRAANVVGKISKGDTTKNTSGLTPQELFSEIMTKSRALIERQ